MVGADRSEDSDAISYVVGGPAVMEAQILLSSIEPSRVERGRVAGPLPDSALFVQLALSFVSRKSSCRKKRINYL